VADCNGTRGQPTSGLNRAIPGYGFSCFPTGDAGLQESRRGWEPRKDLRVRPFKEVCLERTARTSGPVCRFPTHFRKMTQGGKAVSQSAIATRGRQSCPTPSIPAPGGIGTLRNIPIPPRVTDRHAMERRVQSAK
jgi:hypothetical protein